jgi:hypothetical protein
MFTSYSKDDEQRKPMRKIFTSSESGVTGMGIPVPELLQRKPVRKIFAGSEPRVTGIGISGPELLQ